MDKVITIGAPVKDLGGLLEELRKADFEVQNVASDPSKTFVYLREGEPKDPEAIVKSWTDGRPSLLTRLRLRRQVIKATKPKDPEPEPKQGFFRRILG